MPNQNKKSEPVSLDVAGKKIENIAQSFFKGSQAISRRKDIQKSLEDKVVKKIGKKGKYLVDKLFELINGVYVVEKKGNEIHYYKTPPNLNAIIYAIDRVLGKPKQINIQSNFSLSQLLIGSKDGKTEKGS